MRIIFRALQAVVVETIGVVIVLWLLFGSASWTLHSAGVEHAGESLRLTRLVDPWKAEFRLLITDQESTQPSVDVEERLDHYSQLYGQAAASYLKQVAAHLVTAEPTSSRHSRADSPAM